MFFLREEAVNQGKGKGPHPRSPRSGRMSAAEFRTFAGRMVGGSRARSGAKLKGTHSEEGPRIGEFSALPLSFTLPFIPPSINALFSTAYDEGTGRLKRVLTAKARNTRKAVAQFVKGRLSQEGIYELHITVELPCVTKQGKLRKVDVSNRVKFLEDCVAQCLDIDDRQFFRVVLDKLHATHERTIITIKPYQHHSDSSEQDT